MDEELKKQFENNPVARQMPQYKCTKIVWALKIQEIHPCTECEDQGAMIVPAEEGYAPFHVDATYRARHAPVVGGYFVVYKDGYTSFSPAAAFEEGYERI